jgi:hypothetical protein
LSIVAWVHYVVYALFSTWIFPLALIEYSNKFLPSLLYSNYHKLSEWLLFNAKWTDQQDHDDNKLHFDEMVFVLYEPNTISCIFIVLTHCHNSSQIDISLHSIFRSIWYISQLYEIHHTPFIPDATQFNIASWWSIVKHLTQLNLTLRPCDPN